jgi:peptidyl-prolyl cis-trans isomerase D
MLEAIRERAQGWLAKVILALITIPFALWGIDSYFTGGGKEKPAATVGDEEITQRAFVRVLKQQQEQLGGKVEDKVLREQVMNQLVDARLLAQAARGSGFIAPESQVQAMLQGLEIFQDQGKFSEAKLEAFLRNRGMSYPELLELVTQDQLLRQLQIGIGEGALVSKQAAGQLAGLLAQKRDVNERYFPASEFLKDVQIAESAVEADYTAHKADYTTPARARVQFVVLSQTALEENIKIDEQAARTYFEANQARFQPPEQRSAAHILITVAGDADAKTRAAAKAKAEQVYAEASKAPARFAELAKQHSQDPGSAARGGDLGTFAREAMVKPFADAVFSMKPGEVRGPVESEFGYHIIQLKGIASANKVGFDEVKAAIVQELRQQEGQRRFADAAERFSNLVYERPESLEPAAKEFGLALQTSDWITPQPAAPGLFANPRLLQAVFSEDSIGKRQNIEAVEIQANTLVSARVVDYQAPGLRPLAEVAAAIRQKLASLEARKLAAAAGAKALEALKAGQKVDGLSAAMSISRSQPLTLPRDAVRAVFRVDAGTLPGYTGVDSADGYRLYRVNSVSEASMDPQQAARMASDLRRLTAQEELRALLEFTRAKTTVKIEPTALEGKSE